jgi:hypothetical protein
MPQYTNPTSHTDRLIFLRRSLATGLVDRADGRDHVSQATLDAVSALIAPYASALGALPLAKSNRSKEVREAARSMGSLKLHVRDLWDGLKRRTRRMGHPAEVLQHYGLPINGRVVNPTTHDAWLQWGQRCVDGDAAAVAGGYPPMSNPTAADVAAALAIARSDRDDVAEADRTLDLAQAQLMALVPQAESLIVDVMDELRFNTRKLSFPSQRRIQRTYGARFRLLRDERPDDGPDV